MIKQVIYENNEEEWSKTAPLWNSIFYIHRGRYYILTQFSE